jgi:hypothetical protein
MVCGLLIGALAVRSPASPAITPTAPERVERPCDPLSADTAIIVVHGQSNAANFGTHLYSATRAVDNFDPSTGKCFAAVDPLLGADGIGGNFATRLGDLLIEAGRYKRVVIAPIAVAGASIAVLNSTSVDRIENLILKLKGAGLTPTHFLFEQGETDAQLTTTPEQYLTQLQQLVRRFRAAGFSAPFYVSQTTKCDYIAPKNNAAIRAAQAQALDPALDIRRGPDTDTIDHEGRNPVDGCHMSEIGTLANAALWAGFIDQLRLR